MIEVKKFQMSHLKGFSCRDIIADLDVCMMENMMDPKRDVVTLMYQGDAVCFAGVNHLRVGVGEAWIIGGDLIESCKFEFFKTIKGLVQFLFDQMGLHRVEIAIDCQWQDGAKWARNLGFEFESIARAYDFNRRDHAIYVRIV